MKVAIDVHGTIDTCPKFFSKLVALLKAFGAEIHITTGVPDTPKLREQLDNWGIKYDKIFSITNYHQEIGTPIEWDEKGHPHIDESEWDSTKGEYCKRTGIDLAIDDSKVYGIYFDTPYIQFDASRIRNRIELMGADGLPFADWLIP